MRKLVAATLVTAACLFGVFASPGWADPAVGVRAAGSSVDFSAAPSGTYSPAHGWRAIATSGAPPTNASWFADPSQPRINQNINFSGFASDPDGDIATYAWNWGDTTSSGPSASNEAPHAYAAAGTYVVRLTVTDATALSTTYENTITIRNNWAPRDVSAYPDSTADYYPRLNTAATFDFYGYDPEDPDAGDLSWDVELGRRYPSRHDDHRGHSRRSPHVDDSGHLHHPLLGDRYRRDRRRQPKQNDVRHADRRHGCRQPAASRRRLGHRHLSGNDQPDGHVHRLRQRPRRGQHRQLQWDFNGDGVYEAQSSDDPDDPGTSEITHQFTQPGTYAVGLRVTDDDPGASTTYVRTFTVTNPANGPYGDLYADIGAGFYGYSAKVNSPIHFYASVYDPIGDIEGTHYVFHWGDGTGDTSTASADTVHTYTLPGDYRPQVTITLSNAQVITVQYAAYVFDGNTNPYGSYTYGVLHVVDNAPPAYAYAYVTNNSGCLHPNTSLNFTLVGFDPDGGHIATFDVDWNGDGTFDTTGVTAVDDVANVNHTFTIDGTYPVVVRAHDDDLPTKTLEDVYDTQTVEITPDNCSPIAYSTHSPDLPQTNHTITFNAIYSYDLDGTVQTYQWDWDQNGTYDSVGVSPTHAYSTDGDHFYTLKVTDNQGGVGYETGYVQTHTGNHTPFFYWLYISDNTSEHGADRVLQGRRLRRRRHDHPVPVGLGRQRDRRPDDGLELGLARLRDTRDLPSARDARGQRRRQRCELPGLHVHGHRHDRSAERSRRLVAGRAASGQLDLVHRVRLEPQRRDQPVHVALGRRHGRTR